MPDLSPDLTEMRILIVDDQPAVISLLEEILRGQGYTQFKAITDPRNALAEYQSFLPHLILLDLKMPHLDGFAVLKQLRVTVPAGVFLPVLVLTSDVTDEFKIRALTVGATDFLTKPFDLTEVALRIRNLLQSRRAHDLLADQNRLLDEKVRERTGELRQALTELERHQQQIVRQERMHALGEMASGIVHDFNNILALIIGQAELLQIEQKTFQDKEGLSVIVTAAQDGAAMTDRLRDFYRTREAHDPRAIVRLNDLINQTVALTKPKWREQALNRGVTINIETDLQKIPPIQANASELRDLLTNLIFNAVDAMSADGSITLSTRAEDRQVVLEIADTGTGMSPEVQMRCLEPLFTTKGEAGTGMGLAMVYGIVKRHGGSISIESESGKGTTFHVHLPADPSLSKATAGGSGDSKAETLRILAIDCEPVVVNILAGQIRREGHQVQTALSTLEALEKVQAGDLDLVIINQAMPDMPGEKLAAIIKKRNPKLRVILLTGYRGEEKDLPQYESVDLVLRKPVDPDTLRKALWSCFTA